MPDFDAFERLYCDALIAKSPAERKQSAEQISQLPEDEKVLVVKGKSSAELEAFIDRSLAALRTQIGAVELDLTRKKAGTNPNNNRVGKDLFDAVSGREIELKSGGAMTDANPGLEAIAWAVGASDGGSRLKKIMNPNKRREIALSVKLDDLETVRPELEASKQVTMDEIHAYLSDFLTPGEPAPSRTEHYVRCVALGLTKLNEIQAAEANGPGALPLLLKADWNAGLVPYADKGAFSENETIMVSRIERTPKRVQVFLIGPESGVTVKLYPHYKNSWPIPDTDVSLKLKIPAEYWVNTRCFHIWVGR